MSVKGTRSLFSRGYPRTRRYTRISREVFTAWIRRVGSIEKNIPSENVPALLSDMRLYPSKAQVGEMLECATEVADKRSHGEFYNFASQFKRSHDRGNLRQLSRNGDQKKRKPRKMSRNDSTHDVFLGGSCNPTTWRHDVAIPLLEQLGISYYNPQVLEWRAELVEVEHNAKESARVLFYVLDRSTRNVVGIVEAAYFAGSRRHLVLVADTYAADQAVGGETISHTEYEELCSGLETLKDLASHQGIQVFNSIPLAISWTSKVLNEHCKQQSAYNTLRKALVEDSGKLRKLREIFSALDQNGRGEINLIDFYVAYQHLTKNQSLIDLKNQVPHNKEVNPEGIKINFEQFCAMFRDLNNGTKLRNGTVEKQSLCCKPNGRTNADIIEYVSNDIYIGGSCFDFEWKQNIAVPLLRSSGLRFVMAECGILKHSRAAPKETNIMNNSQVLTFILTCNTRGLETMALAAYYIGAKKNIVLCIQELKECNEISGEKISPSALSDYNRGRVYLKDLAKRSGVPCFDNVSETVQYAIDLCTRKAQTSSM